MLMSIFAISGWIMAAVCAWAAWRCHQDAAWAENSLQIMAGNYKLARERATQIIKDYEHAHKLRREAEVVAERRRETIEDMGWPKDRVSLYVDEYKAMTKAAHKAATAALAKLKRDEEKRAIKAARLERALDRA